MSRSAFWRDGEIRGGDAAASASRISRAIARRKTSVNALMGALNPGLQADLPAWAARQWRRRLRNRPNSI